MAAIFESVFGSSWADLPPVLKRRYANRPHTNDVVTVTGTMNVALGTWARLIKPMLIMAGALVPYEGRNIPARVNFLSNPHNGACVFDRHLDFPNRKPVRFRSAMMPLGGPEIWEKVAFGIGWNGAYGYDGEKVFIRHLGYSLRLFGRYWKLPLEWLLGAGYAEERAVDDNRFVMSMHIDHPLFGRVYSYSGDFTVVGTEPVSIETPAR